jgi:hypothetical protein
MYNVQKHNIRNKLEVKAWAIVCQIRAQMFIYSKFWSSRFSQLRSILNTLLHYYYYYYINKNGLTLHNLKIFATAVDDLWIVGTIYRTTRIQQSSQSPLWKHQIIHSNSVSTCLSAGDTSSLTWCYLRYSWLAASRAWPEVVLKL